MQSNIPPKSESELVTLPKTSLVGLIEQIMLLIYQIEKINDAFVKNDELAKATDKSLKDMDNIKSMVQNSKTNRFDC